MKKQLMAVVCAGALCGALALAAPVHAQGPGGPGGGAGGGRGGGFARMRNSGKGRLGRLMRGVGELEKDPKDHLSPAQARSFVAAIAPWQRQQHMDDSQAKALFMKLDGVLTMRQKNDLDKYAASNRHFGGSGGGGHMGGPGGGGPGGPGGAGGQYQMPSAAQIQKMQSYMKTSNMFYPPSKNNDLKGMNARMIKGMNRRYDGTLKLLHDLYGKAKQK